MEIILISGISALIIGLILGYLFAKSRSPKKYIELQSRLDNEIFNHNQTKDIFEDEKKKNEVLLKDIQFEQGEKVKYKTQFENISNQFENLKLEHDSTWKELDLLKMCNADLNAKYGEALKAVDEQKKFVNETNNTLREAFSSLSADALKNNNQSFLDLAKTVLEKHVNESKNDLEKRQQAIDSVINPLKESLGSFDNKIQEIEKAREGAYSEIKVMLGSMQSTTEKLEKGTSTLITALKTSHVRGKYGEIGLRRVVEFAGMNDFCDFEEQVSVATEDGRLKPDMVVKLPGQRQVIVDSKVPLTSYMQAFETSNEEERKCFLQKHALAVREHFKKLSAKSYWNQFDEAPDFVVMYLQIESSFGAALEFDRSLIEEGINNNIIFATPTTLITMLRTIAFSWQQVKVADNIYQIRDAGVELYNRVTTLIQHISNMGSNLDSAIQNYNKVVGSLESRFVPQVKKLKEIGGTLMDKEIPEIEKIETARRPLTDITLKEGGQ
jgi:DNA recombination protein RmuC